MNFELRFPKAVMIDVTLGHSICAPSLRKPTSKLSGAAMPQIEPINASRKFSSGTIRRSKRFGDERFMRALDDFGGAIITPNSSDQFVIWFARAFGDEDIAGAP